MTPKPPQSLSASLLLWAHCRIPGSLTSFDFCRFDTSSRWCCGAAAPVAPSGTDPLAPPCRLRLSAGLADPSAGRSAIRLAPAGDGNTGLGDGAAPPGLSKVYLRANTVPQPGVLRVGLVSKVEEDYRSGAGAHYGDLALRSTHGQRFHIVTISSVENRSYTEVCEDVAGKKIARGRKGTR